VAWWNLNLVSKIKNQTMIFSPWTQGGWWLSVGSICCLAGPLSICLIRH
jgi:hypothetical protein